MVDSISKCVKNLANDSISKCVKNLANLAVCKALASDLSFQIAFICRLRGEGLRKKQGND